jgi:hypothetical protein
VTDESSGQEEPPSHYLDPAKLTDEELQRELTLNFEGGDPERLDYYERLLRERAERRTRRSDETVSHDGEERREQ